MGSIKMSLKMQGKKKIVMYFLTGGSQRDLLAMKDCRKILEDLSVWAVAPEV